MSGPRRLEQEPISNFRRDVVAEDEWRIRVEEVAAEISHEIAIAMVWAVRRVVGQTYVRNTSPRFHGFDVILQASEVLR